MAKKKKTTALVQQAKSGERLKRLKELEAIIEQDMEAWIRIGVALIEIRDEKLYQETHPTLEAWAKERFSISRRHAYRLIDAVNARSTLVSHGTQILPANERQARELTRFDPKQQIKVWNAAVKLADGSEVTEKHVKQVIREMNRQARVERLAEISKGNTSVAGVGKFPIILADPPWRYDDATTDPTRQIENQYPTMSLDEICDMPVESELATDDAVLFLWATAPLLPEALDVMDSWGFEYRTGAVWDKKKIGMGYWFRGQHEHLLVGVRGDPPKPPPKAICSSIIASPRGGHSEKPEAVYRMIEAYYPELPKLEMFARGDRPGWSTWGNQS